MDFSAAEIVGYAAALLIGVTLGLLGGGGSILSVPVLVYLVGIEPILATAYSLFVVGAASLIGAASKFKQGLVSLKTAVVFAIPSFIAVYLTRLYLLPAIPDSLFYVGDYEFTKDVAVMLLFAVLMLIAAISMIRSGAKKSKSDYEEQRFNYPLIVLEGLAVGLLTGMVGAGGGFLIIPALVLLARLPMKLAVGTSLTIIAFKSLFGFIGDIQSGQEIDWIFLLCFTAMAGVGILFGNYISNFISGKKLQAGFGWFVLVMASYILYKESGINLASVF